MCRSVVAVVAVAVWEGEGLSRWGWGSCGGGCLKREPAGKGGSCVLGVSLFAMLMDTV